MQVLNKINCDYLLKTTIYFFIIKFNLTFLNKALTTNNYQLSIINCQLKTNAQISIYFKLRLNLRIEY